ncbi:5-hydroxytryptamine receptor 3A-like [Leptodactylus fuscus]|uniref:5-hydroxytryptamine receptor 3A-like n=1 Tax=Leptodactylus fuscus TaxID=238119 RepID=UPI003F4E6461
MNGYNKGVRPVLNWRKAINVYIDINIYAILEVDEKNQVFSTYIWYEQCWTDEFLTWDPEKFDNITKISIPTDWVWVPDIMVIELVSAGKAQEDSYVYVDSKGMIDNNKPFQIKSTCNFNIYYFPFDQHNCSLTFTSWIHTKDDISVFFRERGSKANSFTNVFVSDGQWSIVKVVPKSRLLRYEDLSFSEVVFYIVIKRKPLFYIVNLILPSMLLMIMNIVGFYIPPESGERTSFKVTLLLGYSVFLLVVSENCPPFGTPLIGSYFVMCMVILVFSVMESIFITRIVHEQNFHRAVPKWLQTLAFEKMSTWLCLKDKDHFITSSKDGSYTSEQKDSSSTEMLTNYNDENIKNYDRQLSATQDSEVLFRILKEVVSIREELKKNGDQFTSNDWLHVGYIIDTFLFRMYILILLIYAISMAAIWTKFGQL